LEGQPNNKKKEKKNYKNIHYQKALKNISSLSLKYLKLNIIKTVLLDSANVLGGSLSPKIIIYGLVILLYPFRKAL